MARRAIDEHILGVMFGGYVPEYGTCEAYFGLNAFLAPGLNRDIVRGVLHDLINRRLCHFRRGYSDPDFGLVPPGYGLTADGITAYLQLSGRERPQSMSEWWREQSIAAS